MGATSGLALKSLQWFIRGVQCLCAALILGVYSYFLAALHNHRLPIDTSVRAVEGISGAAVLYTLIGLVFLCCVAGIAFTSFIAIVLDVCFVGAFIYVAVANKGGASSCKGYVDTPFGSGSSTNTASGSDGFTALPSFHTACRLQTACLAVAIIAIFFFLFSMLMEVALVRHHRKAKRFGPGPANNYTSGYGSKGGFFSRFRRNKGGVDDSSGLPEHAHPDQLDGGRQSYATETTTTAPADGRGPSADYAKQETGYGFNQTATTGGNWQTTPHVKPANYRYEDGVY